MLAPQLMMIGDQAVGKTALLVRYADDDFNESVLPTIGIDFKIKAGCQSTAQPCSLARALSTLAAGHTLCSLLAQTIELQGKKIKLQIWDTAGQERFRTITQAYYRGAMGILLIYDVTNEKSWLNVRNWVRNIEGNAPQTCERRDSTTPTRRPARPRAPAERGMARRVNKILVGNKSDMDVGQRQVTTAQGEQLAREYGIKFFETSARSNTNVLEACARQAIPACPRAPRGCRTSDPACAAQSRRSRPTWRIDSSRAALATRRAGSTSREAAAGRGRRRGAVDVGCS